MGDRRLRDRRILGRHKDIVLNSLALGFITDLDETFIKNVAPLFPADAATKIDFKPLTDPYYLYDSLKGRGLAGKLANAVHVVVLTLVRFQILPLILALPVYKIYHYYDL